ncbi:hypothetical protein QYE76_043756 [Lolium multiflorum]|uniref:Uncharacterized protein n=1 Tax=Lolium multiflorum TaxID=4521 RepID=A0AAD8WYH3_LOLMU|nr:hypothetical protein QYE76_043756 [Lolium multiflorum]
MVKEMGRVFRYLGELIAHEQIDPFRFFGGTFVTSFAVSISAVCYKSSSISSSKLDSEEEEESSNKNNAHESICDAQQPRRIMRTAAAN